MAVVGSWTGAHANALRQALRLTNESFAEHLGVAVRTVAYWRKRPETVPQTAIQDALDTVLERAPDRTKAQFALLVGKIEDASGDGNNGASLWRPDSINSMERISSDDAERIEGIERKPRRLDRAAIESLSQVLAGQRHLEDATGPELVLAPVETQLAAVTKILREAGGTNRDGLADLVAEWISYVGWLRTAIGDHDHALALFKQAENLADETGNGTIAATATSFIGYLARLNSRPHAVIRASAAALATPGAHPTQRTFDMLQTAQAYADLGETGESRRFLDKATDLASIAGEPPAAVYWYTEPFFRLNIGLALLSIGDYRAAAESLKSGIGEVPSDQRNAVWLNEYRRALAYASERT